MDIKDNVEALTRWALNRLGEPGSFTGLPRRVVHQPAAAMPSALSGNVAKLVADLRYPIEISYGIGIHELWKAYETTIVDVMTERTRDVSLTLAEKLNLPKDPAKLLFGSGHEDPIDQLGEAVARITQMAHHVYGCPFIEDEGSFAVKSGRETVFGFKDGKYVSSFSRQVQANPALYLDVLQHTGQSSIVIDKPKLLNLYYLSEVGADPSVSYFLDCAIWANNHGAKRSGIDILDMRRRLSKASATGKVRRGPRVRRLPLNQELYEQGIYLCENAEDPRKALKNLLVPGVISGVDFQARFGNPYINVSYVVPATREKMANELKYMLELQVTDNPGSLFR